jgi:FMN-dependent NADH-azoreductase
LRDLCRAPHPRSTRPRWAPCSPLPTSAGADQEPTVALDDALIAELQAAEGHRAGRADYNFGVPAQLKNWIDAVGPVPA